MLVEHKENRHKAGKSKETVVSRQWGHYLLVGLGEDLGDKIQVESMKVRKLVPNHTVSLRAEAKYNSSFPAN